ncbi:alpha-N-arabinofuranosidase [Undibacterium sp. Jales W-56]|uniref:alpha-N-arabinofuranosidase n=1 Tax=Undibacterium sp. Jales W-56 TaxID=2897325 RepID=UPI0021D3644C|nr:alpha-L-arabinofuranosidase C-terminal domain-containing protein [Undibacterium sp. Jales W-56]MCU6432588.1 alpha-N-arabinofuranosidase [Undibacterium sp. Jales W-56]
MIMLKKSIFASSLLAVTAATLMNAAPGAYAANEVSITIDAKKAGPVINKNIYGQFAEHLGTGVYEGMWVGPESPIPNTKGWRNDVIGALKNMHVPLVRWPGGCFADEYHWRDGIGARDKRPVKMNTNWGNVEENNAVGTHEFFDLVDLLGADAYVNGNLGSGTPQEMAEWVEYLTGDGKSSLAELRRKNGRDKPFKVAFFGIGNEAWGCGGNMTVQHYTSLYNQYASFLKAPKDYMPQFIASGGHDDDTTWTDHLTKHIHEQWNMRFDGISFHYYTVPTGVWEKKGLALGFPEEQWISTLKNTLRMDSLIKNNVAKMDKNDPKKKIAFNVDEWGTWYDVEPGTNPGFLYQQNSLRDALVAALNFNIFHAHAERVRMTNIAQMVNVLQAMILTEKDKMLLTPTYHAFEMYVPFQNATSLPLTIKNNRKYSLGATSIPSISASAARALDGKLYLSLVNTDPNQAVDITIDVAGEKVAGLKGRVLTANAMDAHNTFADPQAVTPVAFNALASGGKVSVKVPAKSVVVVAAE